MKIQARKGLEEIGPEVDLEENRIQISKDLGSP